MSRIESLTEAQEARFAEFADRWTKIGLCTEPADRPRAEAAIRDMYRQGGLEPPKVIVWCDSPLSLGLTRAMVLDENLIRDGATLQSVWDSVAAVERSVWDSVEASLEASLDVNAEAGLWAHAWAFLGGSPRHFAGGGTKAFFGGFARVAVLNSVKASVGAFVGRSVWDSVWESVTASVWASVDESVHASVRDSVFTNVYAATVHVEGGIWAGADDSVRDCGDSHYGGHGTREMAKLAFYRYFYEATNLASQTSKLSGLWELAQSAGGTLPYENICWVSERPHVLAHDERGRLHSLSGPACAYSDGFEIYAVHGVRVPAYVVERPYAISLQRIDQEWNAEVRRVMIERYRHGEEVSGAAAFMRDAGATRLDHDERYGTLWRRDFANGEPIVMVEVINATREADGSFKRYWLRVHPELQPLLADNQFGPAQAPTVRNAIASTFGLLGEEYVPAIEA